MEEEYINEEKERFPVQIENEEVQELIKKAWALEWLSQHYMNQYHSKISRIWSLLEELYSLDMKHHVYTLASEIPTIYYVRPIQEQRFDDPPRKPQLL